MSRQELAERVNTWVWDHYKETVEHSANWICQLEQGTIRWPREMSRAALREILGAPTDAALGFTGDLRSARAAATLESVDRQQLIRTSRDLAALAALEPVAELLAELLEDTEPTPTPTRVGASDIEQIRTATQVLDSWSSTYGGGLVRATAMGQLRCSAGLLKATCSDELRLELHSALGDLADVAGYLAVDAGADKQTDRGVRFALACAEKAGDWPLRGEILSSMAEAGDLDWAAR